jgi:hypothetical protein
MRRPDFSIRLATAALLLSGALVLGGCSGGGAGDLLSTAELEEVQNSPERAREIYEEILRRYPDSAEAARARERLAALAQKRDGAAQGAGAGSRTQ